MSEVFIGESPSTVAEGENAEGSVSSAEQSSALKKDVTVLLTERQYWATLLVWIRSV